MGTRSCRVRRRRTVSYRTTPSYVSLHRQLERYSTLIDFTDPREAERSMRAMAEALRRARRFVGEGNIFLGEIVISYSGCARFGVRNADLECQRALGDVLAVPQLSVWSETVNDAFLGDESDTAPRASKMRCQKVLPGSCNIASWAPIWCLIDLHANLIDILRDALPEFTR